MILGIHLSRQMPHDRLPAETVTECLLYAVCPIVLDMGILMGNPSTLRTCPMETLRADTSISLVAALPIRHEKQSIQSSRTCSL
mmetsp:Transcript_22052/g.21742  ORF Transcript_22052/g.21742 Transcript_22052/m.21742 type:complete len:84 (-) Transcript_22052:93-344(-)